MKEEQTTPSQFIEVLTNRPPVLFNRNARPKTYKAMCTLSERLSIEELGKIPIRTTIVFAPVTECNGATGCYNPPTGERVALIYFSPRLESMPQGKVDSVVAHEFAHIILDHPGNASSEDAAPHGPMDKEADELIKQWGFTVEYP